MEELQRVMTSHYHLEFSTMTMEFLQARVLAYFLWRIILIEEIMRRRGTRLLLLMMSPQQYVDDPKSFKDGSHLMRLLHHLLHKHLMPPSKGKAQFVFHLLI
jgi:hypothetical protein